MRAELRGYLCWTVPEANDFTVWQPEDPEDFDLSIEFYAGPVGEDGADAFEFRLCTPNRFFKEAGVAVRPAAHVLFMDRFDGPALLKFLNDACDDAEGETWEEIALDLNTIGIWQYLGKAVLSPEAPTAHQKLLASRAAPPAPSLWQKFKIRLRSF